MKSSPTKFVDFTEIGNDFRFEKFSEHFLENLGLNIDRPPAVGPDRKRDLVASEPTRFSRRGFRWLVSCKYYEYRIGQNDDKADANKLVEHACDGFMFVYSNEITSGLLDSVEAVCSQKNGAPYHFFSALDIERELLSDPIHTNLFNQYFPESFNKYIGFNNNAKCECDWHDTYYLGEPLHLIAYQKNRQSKIFYKMVCDNCVRDFCIDLDEQRFRYSGTVLIDEFFPSK
ncbi:hypothetical protein R7E49_15865 [Vibrio sp. Vb2110]|nr:MULTISPECIES: hypothetical protein [unclassified Vibrio]MDW1847294.1 hypothetical protein [Vibrio sp. Vb2130]MDW1881387.1 hypothetical protein [Vibrio sp. Vb2110]MDW2036757.1 hypothetical protein [Vibrio sp. 2130-1]MDW2133413.1 hypothetical protein [Vibrio sp. 2128(2023)]